MTVIQYGKNWSPFSELHREVDRLLDDFWSPSNHGGDDYWKPLHEIEEEKEHYLLSLEIPGVPQDQLKLEFLNNQLVISGQRPHGKFSQTFTLPVGVGPDKVEAQYQDGVLKVYIPKASLAKPYQVKIGNGSKSGFFSRLLGASETKTEKEAS